VLISKFIPGVGEEALAILERGDFFGEMALIDRAPRSADARAHTDITVLPIESGLLTDILSAMSTAATSSCTSCARSCPDACGKST